MSKTQQLAIKALSLDLHNFRMVHQPNEKAAVNGMIAINPDWFWALMESLLHSDESFLGTKSE